MRRLLPGLLLGLLLVWGCDQPDEIYQDLPDNYDRVVANGFTHTNTHYFTGSKDFTDPTASVAPVGPSIEVCSDNEVSQRWAWMVNQPIVPMKGAGGLDMTGGEDWSGLTVDEAQSPDNLCQPAYMGDGVVAWGDYYELVAFFDTETRLIDGMLVWPGYLGTIEAGDFVFEMNEPIVRNGIPLTRNDGSNRDPKTDNLMREMDRALISAFRPGIDAEEVDCVETGSCYILTFGTQPVLVFMSVEIYVSLEPTQQRIDQIDMGLKRPFRIAMGDAEVVGVTPTIYGTTAAGIPDCEVTYGTDWADIQANCLAGDPMAMASIVAVYGYEQMYVQMGGVTLYLERPGLAVDEILPLEPVPQAGDTVAILSVNAAYEGDFAMPYSDILRIFKDNLDQAIRDEVPTLGPDDPTGVERLRTPDDPNLPPEVAARYPDRLRPGGIFGAFCQDDGPDDDSYYDSCLLDANGRATMPLTRTLIGLVATTLQSQVTTRLTDSVFYTQQFLRAMGEYFNDAPLVDDQVNYTPSGVSDRLYAIITLFPDEGSFTFNAMYGGNEDRLHFFNFQEGATRMEEVLLLDAELRTPTDPTPTGVFTLQHLMGSPRLGLGATGTVSIVALHPEMRRALFDIQMSSSESVEVLAPYLEASTISGYFIPIEGPRSQFQPADYFRLYGNTFDAGFFMLPDDDDPEQMEIVAIGGYSFFGDVYFCGFPVRIGDYADKLLEQIQDVGYPCELIVRRSENREFITSLSDLDSQIQLYVANNMIEQVFVWER
ncbi:MAG: hypothetical protein JW797_08885 [Bradymonadales bacterium]|nr:hypothetical protein [Bradymonadales bacterium]